MSTLIVVNLLIVVVVGTMVVFTRKLLYQAIILSLYGYILALLFLVLHSPDVALAQGVVNGIILPLLILLALAKVKKDIP